MLKEFKKPESLSTLNKDNLLVHLDGLREYVETIHLRSNNELAINNDLLSLIAAFNELKYNTNIENIESVLDSSILLKPFDSSGWTTKSIQAEIYKILDTIKINIKP